MPDKKKMTVAEILAAARKADQGDAGTPSEPQASTDASSAKSSADAETPGGPDAAEGKPTKPPGKTPAAAPPAKIAKPGTSGRPDVSSILAMARSSKGEAGDGGGSQAGAKADKGASAGKPEKPEKPVASAKAAKPVASDKPVAANKGDKPAKPSKGGVGETTPVRDTASILAAARKKDRPGPLSKAEAAAKATAPSAPGKLTAPPMPVKPLYAQPQGALAKGALAKDAGAIPAAKGAPSKGGAAKGAAGKVAPGSDADRRDFLSIGFGLLALTLGAWTLVTVKFMFPNVLREPPSKFKVGFPDAFPLGLVETKFIPQFGVWIVSTEYDGKAQLFALKSVCTHLGCTPNWLEAEQKFKCPCHGSGFYKDGINFEGPAPRPLERYAIRLADDGQVEIDKSRTFQEEMGQWADPMSYIPV